MANMVNDVQDYCLDKWFKNEMRICAFNEQLSSLNMNIDC